MKCTTTLGRIVRRSAALVAAVGLAIGLAAAPVEAGLRGPVEVTIPFAFNAGRSTMPAGEYTVRQIGEGTLSVEAESGEHILVLSRVESTGKAGDGAASLVFACYGEDRFLSEVRAGWDGTFYRVAKSKSRERLAKAAGSPGTVLVIAAHGR